MATPTLIIGSGPCARTVARQLASQGRNVIMAAWKESGDKTDKRHSDRSTPLGGTSIEWLTDARLNACSGFVGRFTVEFTQNGKRLRREVAHIVIAEESRRTANWEDHALNAGPAVRTLSEVTRALSDDAGKFAGKQIVFLHGLVRESEPVVAAEIMHCARALQSLTDTRAHVLTGNLKVAGHGLEILYREARTAGALFFKFTDSLPTIRHENAGGLAVVFRDDITGLTYRVIPDILVVDETIRPSGYLAHLAGVLRLDTGPSGFLQTENVHRLPVSTNRRGILAVGPSRAAMSPADSITDAACGALAILGLDNADSVRTNVPAEIDTGRCIRCLTCFRLCPYGSIQRGKRIEVIAAACAGCGICFAECPRKAIRLGHAESEIDDRLRQNLPDEEETEPNIVVFCCSRSAGQAHEAAVDTGQKTPVNMKVVTVPCAGAVSSVHIWEAFRQGAAGILVLSCHDGNCHSETGNRHARRRVAHAADRLAVIGRGKERVAMRTLAANMETEWGQITRDFARKLSQLEPAGNR